MAMNKKEKEALADLKKQLFLAKAFRITDRVEPDVPIPTAFSNLSKGFMHNGGLSDWPRVEPACSSSTSHNVGSDKMTSSQRPIKLYSTRLLALRGLRNEVERDCIARLARIDTMIALEIGTGD